MFVEKLLMVRIYPHLPTEVVLQMMKVEVHPAMKVVVHLVMKVEVHHQRTKEGENAQPLIQIRIWMNVVYFVA